MSSFKDLTVYKKAFALAMEILEITKSFPKEECYFLTDQIRRCSRSVNANLAEGYRKRQYPAHFVAKMSDSDMENSETQVWLDFSLACRYINEEVYNNKTEKSKEVGRLLNHIYSNRIAFRILRSFFFLLTSLKMVTVTVLCLKFLSR